VLRSRRWSGGEELTAFEAEMAALTGSCGGVGVNSGTAGLQFALQALGVGPGDEVLSVSYTFVGTLNAILNAGATPVLVDIDPVTLNVDPAALAAAIGPRTRAILLVHLFGRPADLDAVLALARRHGLFLIEDACEAPGARWRGRPVGGFGDAGVFGFYPNKPIAAGEGGMIVSHHVDLLATCRRLRNQGSDPRDGSWQSDGPGYSARLSEWHAALGRVQLRRLEADLARRRAVAEAYRRTLQGDARIELPAPESPEASIAWFTYPIRLRGIDAAARDALIERLRAAGIGCAPYFRPAHTLPPLRARFAGVSLPVTDDFGARCLGLPLFAVMRPDQVERVAYSLRRALERI
jgi:perosamine synthetase